MIGEIIKLLQPKIRGKLIYLSQFGSHLYGLNTENSDLDFRGIYIPTLDDIILKKDKDEINEELEMILEGKWYPTKESIEEYVDRNKIKVDVKIFSLQKFIQLCSKADTNALDLLFSWRCEHVEQYITKTGSNIDCNDFSYIQMYKDKLINTDRLESPITYAFKQATKYGIKGERLKVLQTVLEEAKRISNALEGTTDCEVKTLFMDGYLGLDMKIPKMMDNKHLKIDSLDNKGKIEDYLFVCGVQHQFNTPLDTFIKRIEEKINKEYTSERTKNAKDGNDWKALSHAVRVLLEIQELMETGSIKFPLKSKDFLLDIKLGKVKREVIDEYFKEYLSGIMGCMEQNILNWKYDEEFWNQFIIKEIKNDKQL